MIDTSAGTTTNPSAARTAAVLADLGPLLPELQDVYRDLHRHPELSRHERRTAAIVARRLTDAGYEVTTGVGGTGVVGFLRNGNGPCVLLRGDMDALPVEERTGLPYASTVRAVNATGGEVPVMHACGHDMHITALLGAATLLGRARAYWHGTVMIVAQPSEEEPSGARDMLADGLYQRFGRPDVAFAQHIAPLPAGTIGHRGDTLLLACEQLTVRLHGTGGHGSAPHTTIDPVLMAANVITRLQSVVSRHVDPTRTAVVTVGSVHAGSKANIIPDHADLAISTRADSDDLQRDLRLAIERIVRGEAQCCETPREPEVISAGRLPLTRNDPDTTAAVQAAHRAHFGTTRVAELPTPGSASEDFGEFGLPGTEMPIPTVMWLIGATAPETFAAAPGRTIQEKLAHVPSNHSALFAPDLEPTLHTCVEAMTIAALTSLDAG